MSSDLTHQQRSASRWLATAGLEPGLQPGREGSQGAASHEACASHGSPGAHGGGGGAGV